MHSLRDAIPEPYDELGRKYHYNELGRKYHYNQAGSQVRPWEQVS